LNVAILVVGIGLLSASGVPAGVPIVVFAVGVATAIFAILASYTQHGYYKNARDLKERLEADLGLGDLAVRTTTGMGGSRKRLASLNTFQRIMLGLLILADATGAVAAIEHATRAETPTNVEVVVEVPAAADGASASRTVPIVLSRADDIVASAAPRAGEAITMRVAPGRYQMSVAERALCRRDIVVTSAPLQRLIVGCR
jgi:hypothetical protein